MPKQRCRLNYSASSHLTVTNDDGSTDAGGSSPIDPIDTNENTEINIKPAESMAGQNDTIDNDCVLVHFVTPSSNSWSGNIDIFCKRAVGECQKVRLEFNGHSAPNEEPTNSNRLGLFTRGGEEVQLIGGRSKYSEKFFVKVSGCVVTITAEKSAIGNGKIARSTRIHAIDCCSDTEVCP